MSITEHTRNTRTMESGRISDPSVSKGFDTAGQRSTEDDVRDIKPPVPPFTRESATKKVRAAEDGWNSRDPEKVVQVYTEDSWWRNRSTFVQGRGQILEFLSGKWDRELDYRLVKELWAFDGSRIAVRFAYEWHDALGQWFRSYGNENWEFDDRGLMRRRHASINDLPIEESERKLFWDSAGVRPTDHPGLSELGL